MIKRKWFVVIGTALALNSAWIGPSLSGTILGTKHDFTGLNSRVGVVAMSGVAFSDYGSPCVYCHIPDTQGRDSAAGDRTSTAASAGTEAVTQSIEHAMKQGAALGGNPSWNRFLPNPDSYNLYDSRSLENKVRTPSPISLLCLSCHDGTMALDMTVFKPNGWNSSEDAALHVRLNGGNDLMSCGKCHNGKVAHSIEIKHLGTDLRNDHPISMQYAGLSQKDTDFWAPDSPYGFDNGVKLYDGKVECATCHNVHNPDINLLLRETSDRLCETCHIK